MMIIIKSLSIPANPSSIMVDSDGNNEAAILFNSHATAQMPSNTVFQSLPAVYREYDFITRAV